MDKLTEMYECFLEECQLQKDSCAFIIVADLQSVFGGYLQYSKAEPSFKFYCEKWQHYDEKEQWVKAWWKK